MNAADFRATLSGVSPPNTLAPLRGLWWAAKGDWDQAHRIVQDDEGADAAWVHAYLHRAEGDLPNASYWYRRANRPVVTGSLELEWDDIAGALLGAGA